jgi:predicted DNA-binding protein (MmcQ/YjbR family)
MFSLSCKDKKSILNIDANTIKPANILVECAWIDVMPDAGYWKLEVRCLVIKTVNSMYFAPCK